jgi:ApaG protein
MSMENYNINIKVETNFIKDRSSMEIPIYVFSYNVEIVNRQAVEVQLLSRYWHITDGNRHIEEIRGPGVVGLKPVIQPEETFKYSSFCPLKTPFGVMHGSFQMKNSDGNYFDAIISPFRLTIPEHVN